MLSLCYSAWRTRVQLGCYNNWHHNHSLMDCKYHVYILLRYTISSAKKTTHTLSLSLMLPFSKYFRRVLNRLTQNWLLKAVIFTGWCVLPFKEVKFINNLIIFFYSMASTWVVYNVLDTCDWTFVIKPGQILGAWRCRLNVSHWCTEKI